MSSSNQKLISCAVFTCLFGGINLITVDSAKAYSIVFSNGDFQSGTDTLNDSSGWEGVGSTAITGTYSSVDPFPNDVANTLQGAITTACPTTIQTGECKDDDSDGFVRNDDSPTNVGAFNLSGNDQISASVETPDLQTNLGLSANAFSIQREIGDTLLFDTSSNPVYRVPKEGSAIYQDIQIIDDGSGTNDVFLTFNWDFLTNDGEGDSGDKDFGFVSITNTSSGYEQLIVLEDSTGSIPTASGTDFATNTNTYQAYTSTNFTLAPGTYRVGFGVVDVDGVSNTSALLVDDVAVEEVPFEFSPTTGIGLVLGLIGFKKMRDRNKK